MSNPIDQELLPCPFCGTSDLLGFEPSHEGGWTIVKCRKCGGCGSTGRSTTHNEATAYWNRRAALQPAGVAVPDAPPCWWIDHGSHGQITQRDGEAQAAASEGKLVVRYTAAPHPVSGKQTVDQHNAAYWQEQYTTLRKDYQRTLDERAQDVAGLVEALEGMLEYFPEGHSDGECFSVDRAKKALAAHRAQQGEQP